MDELGGWDELPKQPRRRSSRSPGAPARKAETGLGRGLRVTAFTKLARVHVLSLIGDGAIAVALAGSIFFSIDPSEARWRVALYLVLTITPFAVVTPLLGPAIDRAAGGRRGMIIGSLGLRAVLALLMSQHIDSLLLFPEAFAMLVLQKAYGVSRAALVPAVCPREEELIEANSKLSLLSSIGGGLGGAMGVGLIFLFGDAASTFLAALVFAVGVFAAIQLPQVQVAPTPVDATEKLEVRGANIVLAASAIAILRGIVGFTTFILAFQLRSGNDGADPNEDGSVLGAAFAGFRDIPYDPDVMDELIADPGSPIELAAAGIAFGSGAFLGAKFAPDIRNRTSEERIVLAAMVTTAVTAFLGGWGGGLQGIVVFAFGVAISASIGKLGFDALVQRDAPRSNHGRAFAQFEGRFQLSWAVGAFIAVIGRFPITAGAFIAALAAGFAAISYQLGRRTDKVQASVRVRDAIRERVPQKAVDRIEDQRDKIDQNKAVQSIKPVIERAAQIGKSLFAAGSGAVTAAPGPSPRQPENTPATNAPTTDDDLTIEVDNSAADSTIEARVPTGDVASPSVQTNPGDHVPKGDASRSSISIDEATWAERSGPQVSGDGVWVSPDQPEGGEGEDGQFRLWD